MKNKFVALILTLSCLVGSSCYALSSNEALGLAYDATCRVKTPDSIGTGVVIGYDDSIGKCLVLTNYHVTTKNRTAVCDFWVKGRLVSCQADVVWNYFNASMPADFCLLGVEKEFIDRNGINNVPLAGNEDIDLKDAFFVSAGCPKGIRTGAWKGVITKADENDSFEFKPAPHPGQSGSGIFKIIDDNLWYVGTLTWLVGREGASSSRGAFIPVTNFYQAINAKKIPASYKDEQKPWVAPPDYTECAEDKDFSVIEITTQGCPACVKALADVDKLLDSGVDVSSIDIIDCDDVMKEKYKADKFPTFALINKSGEVVDIWYGYGCSYNILKKINSESTFCQEDGICFNENEEQRFSVVNEDISGELADEQKEDFRKRPPVEDEYTDVGFIEDSETFWNNRKSKGATETKNRQTQSKKNENLQKQQEVINTGAVATRIGNELEQRLNEAGDLFVQKADAIFSERKKAVEKEITQFIKDISARIFWFLVFAIVTGYVIARSVLFFIKNTVFKFFRYCVNKIRDFLDKVKQLNATEQKK